MEQETNRSKQDERWKELSEINKNFVLERYNWLKRQREIALDIYSHNEYQLGLNEWEEMYGKHNLNPKPPTPKTWEDVEKENEVIRNIYKELAFHIHKDLPYKEHDLIRRKILATYQIHQLIDLGYGGMMTEEEWCNNNIEKWTIVWHPRSNTFDFVRINNNIHFITFHTLQQAEEFMSHESNRMLVNQYFLM